MANIKRSLDYFGFSVDFFQDRKIKRLRSEFAEKGLIIYIFILTEIYRNDGYFLCWDKDYPEDIANELGDDSKANLVNEVVNRCINKFRLFDKDLFDSQMILTSKGIQRRYLASKEGILKRTLDVEKLFPKYRLIGDDLEMSEDSTEINGVLRRSTADNGVLRSKEKRIEINGKEEKKKENKGNIFSCSPQGELFPSENFSSSPSTCSNPEKEPAKRFVKPTIEEIDAYGKSYLKEKGYLCSFNPQRFFDHYQSNGWKVGKNPMKDWKATVRNWINDNNDYNSSSNYTPMVKPTKTVTLNENDVLKGFINGK